MNRDAALDLIFDAWLQMDSMFAQAVAEDIFVNPDHRAVSDCAYFVLLFAQLELSINEAYKQRIGSCESVAFRHRVHMLRGAPLSNTDADAIKKDYDIRIEIAHGRQLRNQSIFIPDVVEDYKKFMDQLAD